MTSHRVAGAPLDFSGIRQELAVPGDFAAPVLAEAQAASRHADLPVVDATDIPFVTVDPSGSKDLDQALHLARSADGYRVCYAIADVAAFVAPGAAIDTEAQARGETMYFPDERVPLYPPVLSEGAASLLPGQVRPAVLWLISLDGDGNPGEVRVRRARVRSTAQLDYAGLQRQIDAGCPPEPVALLAEVGELRLGLARQRHAIDLNIPEQEVVPDGDGRWTIELRRPLPVEQWNAEISLLTGICAARIMLDAGVGILRTVPAPEEHALARIRRAARAAGIAWPAAAEPGDVLAGLDRGKGSTKALLEHAASLLRGAGYTSFEEGRPPVGTTHAGIGAPYAHVTAPLRRLVDRYGSEICLAACAGQQVPSWVRERLAGLPETMAAADHRAHEADRAVVGATEAWLLHDRVGQRFGALVLDAEEHAGTVLVDDPPIRARCDGADLPVGRRIGVRLESADVPRREVRFARE
ncbi:MAG: RNB domain-containing ribonuclease [Jatrophihabitans sp.]|nr:MAG: RNB domain-containing ribonuclease [Jatrophihabitans sp.]